MTTNNRPVPRQRPPNVNDPAARNLGHIPESLANAEPAEQRLVFEMPQAELPEPPARQEEKPAPAVELARRFEFHTTIAYRGRTFTIVAEGMTLDQICDLLDKRKYAPAQPAQPAQAAPLATPDDLPEGWKLCKKHGAPMRPRNKQNEHWHSHNVGTAESPCWCKGYKGADSPGYEL